jgi:hypothetical protein
MAITSYTRISRRGWNYPTSGATIGPSNDHTDGTWIETDLYEREIGINTNNGVLQYVASGSVYTAISDIQTSGETPLNAIKYDNTGTTNLSYYIIPMVQQDIQNNNITTVVENIAGLSILLPDVISITRIVYDDSGTLAIPTTYTSNLNTFNPDVLIQNAFFGGNIRIDNDLPGSTIYDGTFFDLQTFTSTTVDRGYYIISYLS